MWLDDETDEGGGDTNDDGGEPGSDDNVYEWGCVYGDEGDGGRE